MFDVLDIPIGFLWPLLLVKCVEMSWCAMNMCICYISIKLLKIGFFKLGICFFTALELDSWYPGGGRVMPHQTLREGFPSPAPSPPVLQLLCGISFEFKHSKPREEGKWEDLGSKWNLQVSESWNIQDSQGLHNNNNYWEGTLQAQLPESYTRSSRDSGSWVIIHAGGLFSNAAGLSHSHSLSSPSRIL